MSIFDRVKPKQPAAQAQDKPPSKFGQALESRLPPAPRTPLGSEPGAAPEPRQVPGLASVINRKEDLPDYVRFDDVGPNAADWAALMVSASNVGLLAIRDDMWTSPRASSLRQVVGRESKYSSVKHQRISARVLGQLQELSRSKSEASGAGAPEKKELHVARALEMIAQGIELDASDIHLEIRTSGRDAPRVVQRMRMHGILHTMSTETTPAACIAWTEVIRGLYQNDTICAPSTRTGTTWSPNVKQEGMLKPPVKNAEVRFESLPEKGGYDVVMRINGYDGKSAARKSLEELGLSDEHARDLTRASLAPHGLIVVVGATGSGKTTTVTTTLALDPTAEQKKRISLEIPPESDIPWLSQLVVTNDTMQSIMDGVMRADPDVISGGEVRNKETGQMAQDFAITGHLTWVTVHANGVILALRRLVSSRLGFDIDILTMRNFLRAALYQALIGKLCPVCSVPAAKHLEAHKLELLVEKFGLSPNSLWVRQEHHPHSKEAKCSRCGGSGVIGRTTVLEVVVPSEPMLAHLREGRIVEAETEWRRTRTARFDEPGTQGKTYVEHALYKATIRQVCAESLFTLENLWNYMVEPLRTPTEPVNEKTSASVLPLVSPSARQKQGGTT